jgi:hypothetical protein
MAISVLVKKGGETVTWSESPSLKSSTIDLDSTKTIATFNASASIHSVFTDLSMTYGKWYWEIKCLSNASSSMNNGFGISTSTGLELDKSIGRNSNGSFGLGIASGNYIYRDNVINPIPQIRFEYYTTGDYYSFAYDADSGFLWIGYNGDWSDTVAGTQGDPLEYPSNFSNKWLDEAMHIGVTSTGAGYSAQIVSQQSDFQGTIPSGFKALAYYGDTFPTPTIDYVEWSDESNLKAPTVMLGPKKNLAIFTYENATNAVYTDLALNTGKWYFEYVKYGNGSSGPLYDGIGISSNQNIELDDSVGRQSQGSFGFGIASGNYVYVDNSFNPSPNIRFNTFNISDYYSVALDMDNGRIWLGHNGDWTDVVAGTQGSPPASPYYASSNWNNNNMRIGASSYRSGYVVELISKSIEFQGTIPSGFTALSSAL